MADENERYLASIDAAELAAVRTKVEREEARRRGQDPDALGTLSADEFEKTKNAIFAREQRERAAKK